MGLWHPTASVHNGVDGALTRALLDPKLHDAWIASARAGDPPPISLVARLQYGAHCPWFVEESYFKIAESFLKDRSRVHQFCFEVTRDGGKSFMLNILRLYLAEYVIPFSNDEFGNPIRDEQMMMVLVGREEKHLRDMIFRDLKNLIVKCAPWLRTKDWLAYVGSLEKPNEDGFSAIANLQSKGAQKWDAFRIDLTNGITIIGRSIRQGIRGVHGYWVDVDDLIDEYNFEESAEFYRLIMGSHSNTLRPGGVLLIQGTPQSVGDLFDIVAKASVPQAVGKIPLWNYQQYPAYDLDKNLGYYEKNQDKFWSMGPVGKKAFSDLPMEDRHCLLPTTMTWSLLESKRGSTPDDEERWLRERMLRRITPNTALVREEYIQAALDRTISYHLSAKPGVHYYLGCDPSSLRSDNAAFAVGFVASTAEVVDEDGKKEETADNTVVLAYLHVMNADPKLKEGEGEIMVISELNEVAKQFSYPDGVVEANGFHGVLTAVGRLLDPSMVSRLKKFQLGANKHTTDGWLSIRTLFRARKIRLPYNTEEDKKTTDALIRELRSIQFRGGRIVENRQVKNDRVSALFLLIQATREFEAVFSVTPAYDGGRSPPQDSLKLPGQRSFSPFQDQSTGGELSQNRYAPGSLQDMRQRLAKWSRTRRY